MFFSNRQTSKKKCVDCTVRMDADVVGPYDMWQELSWQGLGMILRMEIYFKM
jgi:hypothetical protein